jgi:hypothetical protein
VKALRLANGCFLDQTSSAGNTAFVTALPIDPRTGRRFTMVAYMKAVNRVINAAAGRTTVIGNSYESGPRFFRNHTRIANLSRGAAFEAEHWMGATQPRDAETPDKWRKDVQMLIDSQLSGHGVLASFGELSTELTRWEAFVTASMLLGNDGHVWLQFESSSTAGGQAWQFDDRLMNAPLGAPLQTSTTVAGYLHGGIYRRPFDNGVVFVNPSSTPVTVTFPRPLHTLGGSLVTSITLPAVSGTILLR